MAVQYLSMIDPPPEGFTFRKELRARDFRRCVFALAASTVESAEHFLSPVIGKINGLIVTVAPSSRWEQRAPGLYHLQVPCELMPHLTWALPPLLSLIEGESKAGEARRVCALDLDRMTDDVKRLADQLSDTSRLLSSELAVRRSAEKTLEESRKWFRAIFDSVNDAVVVHDAETGVILDVNRRMCELYGYSREEALKAGLPSLHSNLPPYDQIHALERIRQAALGNPQTFEWQARHQSGRLFWVEVSMRVADLSGKACVLVTVRDISERKMEEALRNESDVQRRENQKMESLGVLAGGIAHDFNNLLMTILGNADMTLTELSPTAPARENVNEIIKASRRAAELCAQMLAYAGKGKFVTGTINLNDVVAGMKSMAEASVSKKVSLRFNYVQAPPVVVADKAQIQQIVMNLLINASEAIGDREGTISVSTGLMRCDRAFFQSTLTGVARVEGDYAFLEVRDTGVGIKTDAVSKIFEPFYTTKFTGRGLGLSAVQGIVNSHHGAIKVHSEEGKGTVFTILLPAVTAVAMPAPVVNGDDKIRTGAILLVDDDESIRVMTTKMLKAIGYDVISVPDGAQALRVIKAREKNLACVLLDLNMPVMNGEETYREIRKIDRTLPVIISSGYGEQEISEKFSEQSALGVIRKPYQMATLRHKIEETLQLANSNVTSGQV